MKVAFRVDASSRIGTGHLMRCLTLADALKSRGAKTHFVCRHIPDHLVGLLVQKNHALTRLTGDPHSDIADDLLHSQWLGVSQVQDVHDTLAALAGEALDWLVVDHYALDTRWETVMRQISNRILVIDDIADRSHDCDILLDQNLYADMETRYSGKVPEHCRLLLGPRYALLRDEFRRLRHEVKPRTGPVKRVLVFFGGMDADNFTGKTLQTLVNLNHEGLQVDVVIGAQHPARETIEATCDRYGYQCHVQTAHMAELMAQADLAIGAGGSASWERCCLGLPSLVVSIADNQVPACTTLADSGLMFYLGNAKQFSILKLCKALSKLLHNGEKLSEMSTKGKSLVDGEGILRVSSAIE